MSLVLLCVGCRIRLNSLICDVGTNVSIPHMVDPDTGERSLDMGIDRLVIKCNEAMLVLPSPTFTWTKDGAVAVRDASTRSPAMIDEEFLMQGNNSLLLLIRPFPITVTTALSIEVNFDATNISGALGDMVLEDGMDIRRFILESVLGDWQCTASNAFGHDTRMSTVYCECP